MALIKKKNEEPTPDRVAVSLESTAEGEATPVVATEAAGPEAAGATEPGVEAAAAESEPIEEPAALENSDALLSLFGDADDASADRELIVQMAGEVEVTDLIDELRTVAAALRIVERRAS